MTDVLQNFLQNINGDRGHGGQFEGLGLRHTVSVLDVLDGHQTIAAMTTSTCLPNLTDERGHLVCTLAHTFVISQLGSCLSWAKINGCFWIMRWMVSLWFGAQCS